MTEGERNAQWDQQFEVALGDFDKRLEREQQELEKGRQAGSGGSAAGSSGSGNEDRGGGSGGGFGGGSGSGRAPAEVPAGGTGQGGGENAGYGSPGDPNSPGPRFPAPEGTPSGTDDDVVARQLREAAEQEADPELRARLWEEYRKYKTRKA